jgi:hypothetical protein
MADKPKKKPQPDHQQLARKVLDSVIEKSEKTGSSASKTAKPKRRPRQR